jgi:hypothetical protein
MTITAPHINSLRFCAKLPNSAPSSNDTGLEDNNYRYIKKFLPSDSIRMQFHSDILIYHFACKLLTAMGKRLYNATLHVGTEDRSNEFSAVFDLCNYTQNMHEMLQFVIEITGNSSENTIKVESEPFMIVNSADIGKNVLIEVKNDIDNVVAFNFNTQQQITGLSRFAHRVAGGFYPKTWNLKTDDTIYERQNGQFSTLYSLAFATHTLNIGAAKGIPDEFAKQINAAFSCDNIWIDNKKYTKVDGSKMEAAEADNYPLRSWNIELMQVGDIHGDTISNRETVIADATKRSAAYKISENDASNSVKGYK